MKLGVWKTYSGIVIDPPPSTTSMVSWLTTHSHFGSPHQLFLTKLSIKSLAIPNFHKYCVHIERDRKED